MERPPYTSYAAIMATFAGGLAAAGVLGRALRRFGAAAANDFLQAAFTALTEKTNELESS